MINSITLRLSQSFTINQSHSSSSSSSCDSLTRSINHHQKMNISQSLSPSLCFLPLLSLAYIILFFLYSPRSTSHTQHVHIHLMAGYWFTLIRVPVLSGVIGCVRVCVVSRLFIFCVWFGCCAIESLCCCCSVFSVSASPPSSFPDSHPPRCCPVRFGIGKTVPFFFCAAVYVSLSLSLSQVYVFGFFLSVRPARLGADFITCFVLCCVVLVSRLMCRHFVILCLSPPLTSRPLSVCLPLSLKKSNTTYCN